MTRTATQKTDWQSYPGEPSVYVRDYGGTQVFKLQGSYQGKRIIDTLGAMTIEQVRMIRETLKYNRKNHIPPFSYKDMQKAETEKAVEKTITAEQERKRLIREDKKIKNSTVSQIWENTYWPERAANVRYSKKENQSMDARYRLLIKPFFGQIPISELKKEHFIEFVRVCRETVIPNTTKYYSDSSIRKCLSYMRHLWSVAQEHGLVSGIFPGKSLVNKVKDNERKVCYLEIEEVKLLIDTVAQRRMIDKVHHDVFCYVTIALFLGLRAGDIHKLTPQSIERCIIEETKNGQARFVDFNIEPVRLMLEERLRLYPVADERALIFTTENGKMYNVVPRRYTKIINELGFNDIPRRKNNIREHIDFHALRHTYATHQMVSGGVTRENLQKLLGHKRAEMTMRYVEIADHILSKESKKILDVYKIEPAQKAISI